MTNKEKLAEMLMQEIFGSAIFRTEDDIKHIREKLSEVVDNLIANGVVRAKGKWVWQGGVPRCSNCWNMPDGYSYDNDVGTTDFCPNCGADMRGNKNV